MAIVSLYNGTYLSLSSLRTVVTAGMPYFWKLEEDDVGRYRQVVLSIPPFVVDLRIVSLSTPTSDCKLALPTPQGRCTVNAPAPIEAVTKFIILENTSDNHEALRIGAIGPYAYPGESTYYTTGPSGQILIHNHLDTALYAAVSGPGNGGNAQWEIPAGKSDYWNRAFDASIHISMPLSDTGEQSAQVYRGRPGMILHLQNLDSQMKWRGAYSASTDTAPAALIDWSLHARRQVRSC